MFREVPIGKVKFESSKMCIRVMSGMLLGHIVSQEGIVVDLDKVKVVIEASPLTNAKSLI